LCLQSCKKQEAKLPEIETIIPVTVTTIDTTELTTMKKFLERFLYSQTPNPLSRLHHIAVKTNDQVAKESGCFIKTKESIALGNDVNKLILN
jgi:hypothetical protein